MRTPPEACSGLPPPADPGYEALSAGGAVVRIRPPGPSDAEALRALNARSSDQSLFLRFFGSSRTSADGYVDRLVRAPAEDHAVLVALVGAVIVGVAGYERVSAAEAEVALLVEDAHQGEGIGTLLLEHLASRARRHGVLRFVADTLPQNHRMLQVFDRSGLERNRALRAGVVDIGLVTALDETALEASDERERLAELNSLAPLFRPRSVAVIGAGRAPGGVGHEVVGNLLRGEFCGPVYPINPYAATIAGLPAYPSLGAVGQPVDLAVIAVPAAAVDAVVEDCGRHGVRVVVVLTAYPPDLGNPDSGPSRRSLLRAARSNGIRVVGPNCLGVVNTDPDVRLDASFARRAPSPGGIALASQSGAVGIAALDRASRCGAGVAAFVSLGDKIDISGNDLLLAWDRDPRVEVVTLYLESVGNPRKFARLARRVTRHKPVVLLKGGRSTGGRRAGLSHTAAAATNDVMVDVLCQQAGITRVETLEELVEVAMLLAEQPLPEGGRVGIVGNAGGAGVLAADAAQRAGLEVPELSAGVQAALRASLPAAAVANPVDLGAAAGPEEFATALQAMTTSGEVDAVIAVFGVTAVGVPQRVLAVLAETAREPAVTVVAVLLGVEPDDRPPVDHCGRRLPVFDFPEPAVRALAHAVRYARWRRTGPGQAIHVDEGEVATAATMVKAFLDGSPAGGWVDLPRASAVLGCYGVTVIQSIVASSSDDAVSAAERTGYPVVLKTAAPDVVHKTDVGGVRVGLVSAATVRSAYDEVTAATGSADVLVQPVVVGATAELVVGIAAEPSFGPILMVGLGGVATDVLQDRTFRAAPVTDAGARQMVLGLRAAPLLLGHRGAAAVDLGLIDDLLQRVGRLAADHPEVVELDLNPVLVRPDGVLTVDVKLRLAPRTDAPDPDLRRLRS